MTKCNIIRKENFEISDLTYDKYVKIGDLIDISYEITNLNWLLPDKMKVYLYESDNELFKDSSWLEPKKSVTYNPSFTADRVGTYNFNLSVLDDGIMTDQCEDYKNFTITVLGENESIPQHQIIEYWYLIPIVLIFLIVLWRFLK